MRGWRAVVAAMALVLPLVLTACGGWGGGNWGGGGATSTKTVYVPATATMAPDGSFVVTTRSAATVDTTGAPCNAKTKPGDCWLPLYPTAEFVGDPLNLDNTKTSCTRTAQAGCWPQPGTKLTVVCQKAMPSGLWFGTIMPNNHVLTPSTRAVKAADGVLGYNLARWFKLDSGTKELALCP